MESDLPAWASDPVMLLNLHKQQQAFESKNHPVNLSLIRLTACAETQLSGQLFTQENTESFRNMPMLASNLHVTVVTTASDEQVRIGSLLVHVLEEELT